MRPLLALSLTFALVVASAGAAAAQSAGEIVDDIEQSGFHSSDAVESDLAAAIDRANDANVAFVRLNRSGGGEEAARVAGAVWDELDARGSQYRLVLVLIDDGYYIEAPVGFDAATLEEADLAALSGFSAGLDAEGLDAFTSRITAGVSGSSSGSANDSTTATTTGSSGSAGESGGGIGIGSLLLPLIVIGGGFLLFRSWRGRRQADQAMKIEIENDRAEIKEQLRNNADRVIDLGDRVVLSENRELIDAYDEASRTYQDVSHEIDGASTVEQVDALDDRIDHAEWQFEMIEAKLDGRPVPPSPAEIEATVARRAEEEAARAKAENDKPALGRDESVFAPGPPSSPRRTSYPRTSYPRSSGPRSGYGGRRGGGGLGGLGGILGSILLGRMGRPQSRRSQRRSGSVGGGSLGGGVLRPGGSRGSRRRGSGRSLGRLGRRGSGRSF